MCVCVLLQYLPGWCVFTLAWSQTFIASLLIASILHPFIPPAIYKSAGDCLSLSANIQSVFSLSSHSKRKKKKQLSLTCSFTPPNRFNYHQMYIHQLVIYSFLRYRSSYDCYDHPPVYGNKHFWKAVFWGLCGQRHKQILCSFHTNWVQDRFSKTLKHVCHLKNCC